MSAAIRLGLQLVHTTTRQAIGSSGRSTARAAGKGFFSSFSGKSYNVRGSSWKWGSVVLGAGAATVASKELFGWTGLTAECAAQEQRGVGKEHPQLPTFTREEISKHRTLESGVWVTYKDGVYDITEFLPQHPGGEEKLMLAAGSAIDPYWQVFAQHNSDQVWEMLEEYRIGHVAMVDRTTTDETKGGHYARDPPRSAVLKVNTREPFNAETPPVLLPEDFITPNELFFVRNHLPVPVSEPKTYALEVTGKGFSAVQLTLDDLKTKFPPHTVTATIQCAGNRREELGKVKRVEGISWTGGAIGNATWTGVKLRDVLLYAGLSEGDIDGKIQHIHFEGLDTNPLTGCYGASIPIEKAMDPLGDCLLAFTMNGSELPRDHGYPVRVIVPGTVGARNVKWLAKIVASDEEYDGHWQQRDYKGFSPSVDSTNVDFSKAPAIQEMPVQSLICSPQEGASFDTDEDIVTVQGLAWSGGGRKVVRVDVSGDGGKSWVEAILKGGQDQKRRRAWAWSLWEAAIPVTADQQAVQLCCKAVDDSYNVQPDSTAPIWNLRGCLSNAWHRVNINRK